MRTWRGAGAFSVVAFGVIVINCIPHPQRAMHGWQFGWPWVSVDALPALMTVPAETATYDDQLQQMQVVWRLGVAGAGRNWAKDEGDPDWRWLRLSNGHVIQFSASALCSNALAWLCAIVVVLCAISARRRGRAGRLCDMHCSECGYNLRGNESGVCPECGCPVAEESN